jgi:tetratricopeptide (TPR) repeat protein
MKKLVFASAMALASLGLIGTPNLTAQEAGGSQVSLPPAEFNAYQTATTETNPQQKAAALESFLQTYPQSPVKKEVLDQLMDTYRQLNNLDKELSACNRLLQVDPNDLKAILYSVIIKQEQCGQTVNAQTGIASNPAPCDDAATLGNKGLAVAKPADVADQDWKNETSVAYPMFHSAIALDDTTSKKDYADAVKQYTQELMLYPPEQTTSGPALIDTLKLAYTYARAEVRNLPNAIWFFARVWDYAPPAYQAQIEPQLEYWYKRFHGGLDGLDAVKAAAKTTVFPPASFKIAPAPTPPEVAHNVVASTPDLTTLNLEDKEYILANGNPDDQQKLWSVLQGKATPVIGTVTNVTSTGMTVHIEVGPHVTHDFTVALKNPMPAATIRAVPDDVQQQKQFIDQNGVADDVAKVDHEFALAGARARKVELEPNASEIDMAVTQDAKQSNKPDFIVNLSKPAEGKAVPAPGFEFKTLPNDPELDGTYSSYKPVPAQGPGGVASAQIVLSDGLVQMPQPKAPVRRAPVRRPVHHTAQ